MYYRVCFEVISSQSEIENVKQNYIKHVLYSTHKTLKNYLDNTPWNSTNTYLADTHF